MLPISATGHVLLALLLQSRVYAASVPGTLVRERHPAALPSRSTCGHCLGHCPNPHLEPRGGCRFPCESPATPAHGCCIPCNSTAPPPPPPLCAVPPSLAVVGDHGNELLLPPPDSSAAAHERWLKQMLQWRDACRRDINYTGEIYTVQQLKWTQTSACLPTVAATCGVHCT